MKHSPMFVFGTRPEIIKISGLAGMLGRAGSSYTLVNTGQHYSPSMSRAFLEQLDFPEISHSLGIGRADAASQVSLMLSRLRGLILKLRPSVILAEGDTNSVLAAALAANLTKTKFGHIEAGLRSFDRSMPEESNRIVADQLASHNFAPTRTAVKNLKDYSCSSGSIHLTGNTIVEVTRNNLRKAAAISPSLPVEKGSYYVLTLHRAENTDNRTRLSSILRAMANSETKIVFPVHPRTKAILKGSPSLRKLVSGKNVILSAPLPYLEFLSLCRDARLILSDSGGIQEEATIYKKPVIVLRQNTERPEILGTFGWLAGYETRKIQKLITKTEASYSKVMGKIKKAGTPFGDGRAGRRIIRVLEKDSLLA
jgi:UDP-N-acetylglucosamine 2-epimerase (non-hydrolysing)